MMRKIRQALAELRSNRIMRGALSLIVGSAMAKGIGLAIMPVLTRLYTAEDFGRLALFVSVTTIVASLLTFRYVVALPIPRSKRRASHLLLLNVILIVLAAIVLASVLAVAVNVFGLGGNDGFWRRNWYLVVIGSVGAAGYELATMWATREQRYKEISRSQVWQMLSGSAAKLAGGVAGLGSAALILGQVVQQSGGLAGLLSSLLKALKAAAAEFDRRYLTRLALKYSDFPRFKLPAHLIYAFAAQAPVILVSYFWGTAATGQLGLAFQALAVPVALISQNSSRVYYAELSKIGRASPAAASKLTRYMAKRLFVLGIVLGVTVFALAPIMFTLVFGVAWSEAGELARAMAIFIPFQFVASPLIMAYNIYGNQRQVLVTHVVRALLVSAVFLIGNAAGLSVLTTIYIYSVVISFHYILVCRNVVHEISLAETSR